jgi:hypothetical protein
MSSTKKKGNMKILIGFKNQKTGEIKNVKCGWSWTLFLWSGVFGIPLFLRRLNVWGSVFLVLWVVNLLAGGSPDIAVILFAIFLILQIWLGIKGNEMTAKNYLEHDWIIAEPDSEFTKMAKKKWGINI